MTNNQNNDLNMLKAVRAFFKIPFNATKVAANAPLAIIVAALDAAITKLEKDGQKQGVDTKGYTVDKDSAKGKMVLTTAALGTAGSVYFALQGENSIAESLKVSAYKLGRLSGNEAKNACKEIYEILVDNKPVLDPDYVTSLEMQALSDLIDAYDADADAQTVAKNKPTVATGNLVTDFKTAMDKLHLADNLMGKYVLTDINFLEGYHESRKVLNIGVHHSGVEGTIKNGASDALLQGVQVLDVESGKKVVSNAEGFYNLEELEPKQRAIKVSCAGFVPQDFTVTIKSGKHVHLDIALMPV